MAVVEGLNSKPQKSNRNIIRNVFIFAVFLASLLFSVRGFSQGLEGIPDSVRSPQALVNWFASEFKSHLELIDEWQSPQETIGLKKGDCEDFAILASEVLKHLGVDNDILIVKFASGRIAHAICAWKDKNRNFSFISNKKLFHTGEKTIECVIEKYYPDWETIILTNENGHYLRTLAKKD